LKDAVKLRGHYNLKKKCDDLDLEYDEVVEELEGRLDETDQIIDSCGVVVSQRWIEVLKDHVRDSGKITVTEFAKKQGLPLRTAVCLLRALLQGVYVASNDTFFAKS
jgi:hypothetical protein